MASFRRAAAVGALEDEIARYTRKGYVVESRTEAKVVLLKRDVRRDSRVRLDGDADGFVRAHKSTGSATPSSEQLSGPERVWSLAAVVLGVGFVVGVAAVLIVPLVVVVVWMLVYSRGT